MLLRCSTADEACAPQPFLLPAVCRSAACCPSHIGAASPDLALHSIVRSNCDGQESCETLVAWWQFGDLCPGVQKILVIRYM